VKLCIRQFIFFRGMYLARVIRPEGAKISQPRGLYVFSVLSQSSSSSFVLGRFRLDALNPVGCLFLSPFLTPTAPITNQSRGLRGLIDFHFVCGQDDADLGREYRQVDGRTAAPCARGLCGELKRGRRAHLGRGHWPTGGRTTALRGRSSFGELQPGRRTRCHRIG
jgi:hypothetical protein